MEEWIKKSDAIEAIKSLVIIHTESRYLNDLEYGHNEGLAHAIDRIEDIPSADRPKGWIPCTERLPDERQDVYVTVFWDNYGDTVTAYGRRTQFGWSLWNTVEGELLKGYTVTAWMPLPEPWKGADDDTD